MNRQLEYLRVSVVSPECAAILIAWAVYLLRPDWLALVGTAVTSGSSGLDVAALLAPWAALAAAYRWSDDLLNPSEKKVLIEWPEYWRIKGRVWIALLYAILGVCAWMVAFILLASGRYKPEASAVLVASAVVVLLSTGTIAAARLQLKDVLAGG